MMSRFGPRSYPRSNSISRGATMRPGCKVIPSGGREHSCGGASKWDSILPYARPSQAQSVWKPRTPCLFWPPSNSQWISPAARLWPKSSQFFFWSSLSNSKTDLAPGGRLDPRLAQHAG